jgi:hypothetical protein
MIDATEPFRRAAVVEINSQVESDDLQKERARLAAQYGQVWNTDELRKDFEVKAFMAPFVVVKSKIDGTKGTLMFQHYPRFYFGFERSDS